MQSHLSIWALVMHADWVVKLVLLFLLGLSITSWVIIFDRYKAVKLAKRELLEFQVEFWSGVDMQALYQKIKRMQGEVSGAAYIFYSGFQELIKRQSSASSPDKLLEGADGMMRVAMLKEGDQLDRGISLLATIGSVSPYIGLFGTVWGIMNAFQSLGMVEQATLQMVAPGISEALVATAMGLFVAIPAVIAYNRFTSAADYLVNQYENFKDEYSGLLHRQLYAAN